MEGLIPHMKHCGKVAMPDTHSWEILNHLHKPKFSLWKLVTEIQSLTAAPQASFPAPTARGVIPPQGHKSASSREETSHSVIVHLFFIRTGSIFEAKELRNKGEDV